LKQQQAEIIDTVLAGKDRPAVMPSGWRNKRAISFFGHWKLELL